MNIKETKKRIIQAGHKAVDELIKVAKEAIVDSGDDITADRLKNAAATKKLAIFDAFEIPLTLNISTALSKSPFDSSRAELQSLKPAPVDLRSCLTLSMSLILI